MILRHLFALKIQKSTDLLIFNSLEQKKLNLTFVFTATEKNSDR